MFSPVSRIPTGVGIGLRRQFAAELAKADSHGVDWIEIHPENYVGRGGPFAKHLREALGRWQAIPHGLTLAFGDTPARDEAGWLRELRAFLDDIDAPFYSDHLCITSHGSAHSHDLLPMPRNRSTAAHAVERVHRLRDALGRPIAIENVSAYAEWEGDMDEAGFVAEVVDRADALLLLDVNNVIVNHHNLGIDPVRYLDQLPLERVVQIHVAGHELQADGLRLDTHSEPVGDEALALLAQVIRRVGPRAVLLERDGNIPPLAELLAEVSRIRSVVESATLTWRDRACAPAGCGAGL